MTPCPKPILHNKSTPTRATDVSSCVRSDSGNTSIQPLHMARSSPLAPGTMKSAWDEDEDADHLAVSSFCFLLNVHLYFFRMTKACTWITSPTTSCLGGSMGKTSRHNPSGCRKRVSKGPLNIDIFNHISRHHSGNHDSTQVGTPIQGGHQTGHSRCK
jgi:hypothetical protein